MLSDCVFLYLPVSPICEICLPICFLISLYLIHLLCCFFPPPPFFIFLSPRPGLSSLFEGADLCGLYSEDRVVLGDTRHRALLTLTEQGVEAGAATSVSFSRSFPSFSAMQPFIMLLWSDQANVPLFVGRVTDP